MTTRQRFGRPVGNFPQRKQTKFSVQPFEKGWQVEGGALLAFRRKRNPTCCASGATQKEGKAARRPPADVPAAAILKKLRHDILLIHPKRKSSSASRSVLSFPLAGADSLGAWWAGLRPAGNPIKGFPFAPTSHRDVGAALPDLLVSLGGFRPLRRATKGSAFGICQPFEKGWTENLVYARCGTYPTGRSNRRRAACRAANET